ncbi:transglycosylase [Siccirubricoccus phaeus]|uniref:transglycosylase n=1 Tax=Siccirubricoccus phaeus TaxID=2595053 RepID=UPI001F27A087|nr:transglycosylase [Siccirubricoccus phaeus]
MAALLVTPLILPMGTAQAGSNVAGGGAVAGDLRPLASHAPAQPPHQVQQIAQAQPVRAPRLPDAPQELLPPAEPALVRLSPQAACLAAARRAEQVHGLPEGLLVAIALSESGLHAHALNIGGRSYFPHDFAAARALLLGAAPSRSVMAGCVQVNARVHARGADWPLDPVRSADWAGGLLRRWYTETGSWAEALRRWHGGSPASTRRVMCRVRAKLEVTAPGSNLLPDAGCSPVEMARIRRSGAALLEVAEAP